MNRSRSKPWLWILLALFVLFAVGGMGLLLIAGAVTKSGVAGPQVGLIEYSGVITDEGARGLLSGGPGDARDFVESVEAARRDGSIKAVVIRINSPGGSAAASQEMYRAVRRLREDKPVVCSMGDMAASGGYYVAAASDKIYANGSTITGSIGVISQFINLQKLLQNWGVDETIIKSGQFKDAGNPLRPMQPVERQLFQTMIMDVYNQFVNDIVAGRKAPTNGALTKDKVLKLADGRVFTGQQAKAAGLVDQIGGLHEAVQEAGRMAGIKDTPKVREISAGSGLGALFGANAESAVTRSAAAVGAAAGHAFAAGLAQRLKAEATELPKPEAR